jgi:type IV secretory pathway TrbL component
VIVWVAGGEASVLEGGGGVIAGGATAVVVVFNKALAAAWNASKVLPEAGGLMALTIPGNSGLRMTGHHS